jgi:hypothetical protein
MMVADGSLSSVSEMMQKFGGLFAFLSILLAIFAILCFGWRSYYGGIAFFLLSMTAAVFSWKSSK